MWSRARGRAFTQCHARHRRGEDQVGAGLREPLDRYVAPPPPPHTVQHCLRVCGRRAGGVVAENTWTLKSYVVKKYGMAGKDVDAELEIPEDFDILK